MYKRQLPWDIINNLLALPVGRTTSSRSYGIIKNAAVRPTSDYDLHHLVGLECRMINEQCVVCKCGVVCKVQCTV